MECHGKCQMKKEAEKKIPETNFVKIGFELNVLPQKLIEAPDPEVIISQNEKPGFENYIESLLNGFHQTPFNPPQILS